MNYTLKIVAVLLMMVVTSAPLFAQPAPTPEPATPGPAPAAAPAAEEATDPATNVEADRVAEPPVAPSRPLTVAVINFAAKDPAAPELGQQIAEALSVTLSVQPGITLVDRQSIQHTLSEQELNLTGLVNTDQAVQIGKLVGARIIVTGSAFTLGKQLIITAKLIGTETSLVDGVMVKGDRDADLGELFVQLSDRVGARLVEVGPRLVAANPASDPLPALKQQLAGRTLPTVAVIVREQHHASPRSTDRPIDPAVESELKRMLLACGFTVRDVSQNELTNFAKTWTADNVSSWPQSLAGVDMIIVGQAFSEHAARIGNLVSCSARAEINLINRKDGRVVHADRATTRAADLSEQIAGKSALEKAGRELGLKLLNHFANTLPPVANPAPQQPAPPPPQPQP